MKTRKCMKKKYKLLIVGIFILGIGLYSISLFTSNKVSFNNLLLKSNNLATSNANATAKILNNLSKTNVKGAGKVIQLTNVSDGADIMDYVCPGCLFTNSIEEGYTTWNTSISEKSATTAINGEDGVTDDYTELGSYFLGLITNDNNEVTNAFACGFYDDDPDKPFCIEGGTSFANSNDVYFTHYYFNRNLLQSSFYWDGGCSDDGSTVYCAGSVDAYAFVYDNGDVYVSGYGGRCEVRDFGYFNCEES